jgi:glycosyltransferase involved in cell wall biosynthesis
MSKFGVLAGISIESKTEATFGDHTYYYDCPHNFYVLTISGRQLYENPWLLSLSWNSRPHVPKNTRERQYFSADDYFCVQIVQLSKEQYSGKVYDLEIEEDHTYLVNGKGVSNSDAGGYARMNRKFMAGLRDSGVRVSYEQADSINDMDKATCDELRKLAQVRPPKDAPKIYGMTAPLHYDWSRYKMLFTMMETRRLHEDYVTRCDCADEIIVPSRWCKTVFEESGVKKPISVVPLGVDLDIYRPDVQPIGFSKGLKPYVFLSVFGWSLRKGYDVLLRAYLEEFTSDDPVTLLISSRYFGSTDECKKQVIRDDMARISALVPNQKKPQVVLFGDVLSDAMMPRLYASADCYVLISRGEGFGLPFAEAGACRIPVIGSRYSGQTDFLDDDNSYLVDVDGFRSADTTLAWISYFYEDAEFPIFGKKAVEQTRYFMRKAFENKEEAEQKANKLHERIVSEYSWPLCVQKMKDKLKETYDRLSKEH